MSKILRFSVTSAIVFGGAMALATTAHAQQFGPPQQSLYAHNPGSAPTYVSSNQYVPSIPATSRPVQTASNPGLPAHRPSTTHASSAAHPVTLRKKSTPSASR